MNHVSAAAKITTSGIVIPSAILVEIGREVSLMTGFSGVELDGEVGSNDGEGEDAAVDVMRVADESGDTLVMLELTLEASVSVETCKLAEDAS